MPLPQDFLRLMNDTVAIATRTADDAYGTPSYAAPVSYPAYLVRKPRMVRTLSGEETVSSAKVILGAYLPALSPHDQITLPDGTTPVILYVESHNGPAAIAYSEVYT